MSRPRSQPARSTVRQRHRTERPIIGANLSMRDDFSDCGGKVIRTPSADTDAQRRPGRSVRACIEPGRASRMSSTARQVKRLDDGASSAPEACAGPICGMVMGSRRGGPAGLHGKEPLVEQPFKD
jgi:hypothetical protein